MVQALGHKMQAGGFLKGMTTALVGVGAALAILSTGAAVYAAEKVFISAVPALPDTLGFQNYQGNATRDAQNETAGTLVITDVAGLPDRGCTDVDADKMAGNLATSWTTNADKTEIIFTLRNAKSEWGNELTADDVKYTILTNIKNYPVVGQTLTDTAGLAEPYVTVIDDKHVKLHVKPGRYSPLTMSSFARFQLSIMDSKEISKHATSEDPYADKWLASHTANFGPWKLESFTPKQQVTYVQNPGYPGKRGNIDKLIIQAVPEASTRASLMSRGEVQAAAALSFSQYKQLDKVANIYNCAAGDQDTLTLNFAYKPFADVRVREAVSLAIDRELLARVAHEGFDRPAIYGLPTPFIAGLPAEFKSKVQTSKYDVTAAKRLMKEAGYGDGFTVELLASNARPGPYGQAQATLIASQLKEIGITANITLVDGSTFSDRFYKKSYQMIQYGQFPALLNAYYITSSYLHSGYIADTYNYDKSAEMDAQGDRLRDPTPAKIVDMANYITTKYPMLYLVDNGARIALAKNISGFEYRAQPILNVYTMTIQ